ncbi:hypothetical protein HOA92_00210 [archaeon]|jgi:hypothetical protein|nr:hypothetical protein [archaeon]MBT6761442.1 hypothetical protein [archaeon]
MNTKILLLLTILAVSSILISCASVAPVAPELACEADTDCTAALCCHSDSAVNNDYAPNCQGMLCTADCQPGTMDCGQAVAKCVQGACTVVQT